MEVGTLLMIYIDTGRQTRIHYLSIYLSIYERVCLCVHISDAERG